MGDVIIVGAGICGLSAARELALRNRTVTVLEARDRIGGRINTFKGRFSTRVEQGAEFVHGKPKHTHALIEEAGLQTVNTAGDTWEVRNGKVHRTTMFPDTIESVSQALGALTTDITMKEFLDRHFPHADFPKVWEDVRHFIEGFDAADLGRISALAIRNEWSAESEFTGSRISGGYGELCEYLGRQATSRGVEVWLSSPVAAVTWTPGKVEVVTTDGEHYEARQLIITVPASVLRTGAITFSAGLDRWQDAVSQIETGGVIKFLFEFQRPLWQDKLHDAGFIFSDALVPTWWTQLPETSPILTGWLAGPATLTAPRGDALTMMAVESLAYLFNYSREKIINELRAVEIADWSRDPFSLGGYAYKTPDTAAALEVLATPVYDTIYFAGEAFNVGEEMGTVEAALQSAASVVRLSLAI
jgi:monoamine oxidase